MRSNLIPRIFDKMSYLLWILASLEWSCDRILASHWSRVITWSGYWPLIGRDELSRDQDTGFSLVEMSYLQAGRVFDTENRYLSMQLVSCHITESQRKNILTFFSKHSKKINSAILICVIIKRNTHLSSLNLLTWLDGRNDRIVHCSFEMFIFN